MSEKISIEDIEKIGIGGCILLGALSAIVVGGLLAIPAIPGAVLWFFLHPATFWEKFAWLAVSLIAYFMLLGQVMLYLAKRALEEDD